MELTVYITADSDRAFLENNSTISMKRKRATQKRRGRIKRAGIIMIVGRHRKVGKGVMMVDKATDSRPLNFPLPTVNNNKGTQDEI